MVGTIELDNLIKRTAILQGKKDRANPVRKQIVILREEKVITETVPE